MTKETTMVVTPWLVENCTNIIQERNIGLWTFPRKTKSDIGNIDKDQIK